MKPMSAEARPTDKAPAIQRRDSKCGDNAKSFVMPTPIMAEKNWPPMILRGWASGESIVLYSRTAEAP